MSADEWTGLGMVVAVWVIVAWTFYADMAPADRRALREERRARRRVSPQEAEMSARQSETVEQVAVRHQRALLAIAYVHKGEMLLGRDFDGCYGTYVDPSPETTALIERLDRELGLA